MVNLSVFLITMIITNYIYWIGYDIPGDLIMNFADDIADSS